MPILLMNTLTIGRFAKLDLVLILSYRLFSQALVQHIFQRKDMTFNIDDVSLVESPVSKIIFPKCIFSQQRWTK